MLGLNRATSVTVQLEVPEEPDTFLTDRRWLLGQRYIPLRLEKREKLPRNHLTHYARSGTYTLTVLEKTDVMFGIPNKKSVEHTLKSGADAVAIAPFDGYFMLIQAAGLAFVKNTGELTDIPLTGTAPSSTAHHWVCTESEMYFLFGTVFGQIFEVAIRYQETKIPVTQLHRSPIPTPIWSLTSASYAEKRFVLVCQNTTLTIFTAPAPSTPLDPFGAIAYGSPERVPSFVAANARFVVWMTIEELRVYALPDLFGAQTPTCSLPFPQVAKVLESDPYLYLSDPKRSVVLTEFYVLLAGPTAVVGFSAFDCSVAFRLPFAGGVGFVLPLTFSASMNCAILATSHNFYRINLEAERPPTNVPTLRGLKQDLINRLKSQGLVSRTELLSALLESADVDKAIRFLSEHLKNVLTQADRTPDETISQTKIQRLCEEFLMYELQIYDCCQRWSRDGFNPEFLVRIGGNQFDSYGALSKLLHIRGFTPLGWAIESNDILDRVDSPLSIRKWLEQGKWLNAIEKIRQFGTTPDLVASLIFTFRDKLVSIFAEDQLKDPKIAKLAMRVFPFVVEAVTPESAMILVDQAIHAKRPRDVNILVHAICVSGTRQRHDAALCSKFPIVPNEEGARIFFNPLAALQDLQASEFHRSAAWLAHSLGLWSIAAHEAIAVEVNLAKHYIHRAPRTLQADLCREVDIEFAREDGQALRLVTKNSVTEELRNMLKELDALTKQSEQSAHFLKELDEWGSVENPEEKVCGICRRKLIRTVGYRFPCGHAFHEKCLMDVAKQLLSVDEVDLLGKLNTKTKPTQDEAAKREKLIAGDCPLCGEKAVTKIRKQLVVPGASTPWSFDLADLSLFKPKQSARRIFSAKP
jgi:hypothetical protein